MPEPYPNPLTSIVASVVSLRHYARIHDQPFSRTLLYLVVLTVLVTALSVGLTVVSYGRTAGALAAQIEEKLADVTFEDARARAKGEQPRQLLRTETLLLVLDARDKAGALDTVERAAEFAGCATSAHIVFLGRKAVVSFQRPRSGKDKGKHEKIKYSEAKKLGKLRALVEAAGGRWPKMTITDGVARFDLPPGRVHVIAHSRDLMAMADATGKDGNMGQVVSAAAAEDEELRAHFPPPFLTLLTASGVHFKAAMEPEAQTWGFASGNDLSGAAVARWLAARARQTMVSSALRQALPSLVSAGLVLLLGALVISVAGLIVSGLLRAGLAYGELLSIAAYAMTPAAVVFFILVAALRGRGGPWVLPATVAIGAVYVALGTWRTARSAKEEPAPTI